MKGGTNTITKQTTKGGNGRMEEIQFTHTPLRKLTELFTEAVQTMKRVFSRKTKHQEPTEEKTFREILFSMPRFYVEPEPTLEELGIRRVEKMLIDEYPSIQEVENSIPAISWREFKANNRLVDQYFTRKKEVVEQRPKLRLIS